MMKNKRDIQKNIERDNKAISFTLVEVIVFILITGLIVSVCSGFIVYNNLNKSNIFKEVNTSSNISDFADAYNHIINSYVNEVDEKELIESAIKGMYEHLEDEYSIYLDEDTTSTLNEQLQGEYEGVGIEITINGSDEIVINKVFLNSPAERAGLKKGDILIELDGKSLEDKTSDYVATTIKKSDKEVFDLKYLRNGKEYTVQLKREHVYINSVSSKEYEKIGYIKIETFSSTTRDQVKDHINKFNKNIDSIIIDVRDNTGGYLSSALSTSNLFIDKGKCIYQLKDKNGTVTKEYASSGKIKDYKNLVVLINEYSASASEILATALKESAGAYIVGVKSFGKGTVQETDILDNGAMVKYTTAYWLTPKGNSINKVGIKPDYEIEDFVKTEKDEQLEKALDILKNK